MHCVAEGNKEEEDMLEYYIKSCENISEEIAEILNSVDEECVIHIGAGRYFLKDTIEICNKKNIKLLADGEVIFDGGVILKNSDIKDYDEKIKYIDLKPYHLNIGEYGNRGMARNYINAPNELFVDGEAYSVSRYPKHENIPFLDGDILDGGNIPRWKDYGFRGAKIRCRDERIKKWANAKDAYLGGMPKSSWADDCIKIKSIDAGHGIIETSQPHLYGFAVTGHSGWYIVNLLEEVTEPGEYYIDIQKEILYFIPQKDVSDSMLQISNLDTVMVAIENSGNVEIEGIIFENARNSGIYIEGGQAVKVRNCEFRNLGVLAVQIGQGAKPQVHGLTTCHGEHSADAPKPEPISREMGAWYSYLYEFSAWDNHAGENHMVENCKIHHTGAGGMLLSGGNRKKLTAGNNRVHNCEFYQCNRLDKTYKAAVNLMGVGNIVSHCEIYDMPSMAIYLHGNDHVIEYNKIHDVVKEVSDAGAIYMGRDMSEVGNVFRNNYIYNLSNSLDTGLGVSAIYFDDWAVFNAVYDNFFYNIQGGGFCVISHTCGGLLSFHNNFVIDCVPGIQPDNKSNSYINMHRNPLAMQRVHTTDPSDMHGVDITSERYREKYPYLYETYKNDARYEWMYYNNILLYHKYDIFVDGRNGDFTQVESFGKTYRDEYDWMRRTDVIMGYDNDLVLKHPVEFKTIGLIG